MGKKKSVATGPRVDRAVAKVDTKSRTDISNLVKTKATTSPIWQAQPAVQDAGQKLITAGANLASADLDHQNALKTVDATRTVLDTRTVEWNGAFEVYASNVETNATKPDDVSNLALTVASRNVYPLAAPLAVLLKQDLKLHLVRIHVQLPKGLKECEIEVSSDGTNWKRLVGNGVMRTIENPAPGNLWVRAAASRANDQSPFTDPVQIVVK